MKQFLLILILSPFFANAQDWTLFPLHQQSYFEKGTYLPTENTVKIAVADSLKTEGEKHYIVF